MQPKIIENFINKETCNYIMSYMAKPYTLDEKGKRIIHVNEESGENAVCMGWYPEIETFLKTLKKENLQNSLIYDLFNLIGQNMCSVFDFKQSEVIYETSHYKYFGSEQIGDSFGSEKDGENGQLPHTDQYGMDGQIYTAVLYLNDEYVGGDVIFYENNDESKPTRYRMKAGSLMYFSGLDLHAVENVTAGKRASFVLHIRVKEKN
jgi:predicted 2-oxoglutarate/Fe(II)-dependent dioxygenase YbiX